MGTIRQSSKFLWIGNWPVIDFLNTEHVIDGVPGEFLREASDVVQWLAEAGLAVDSDAPPEVVEEARSYRSALRGFGSDAIERTNGYLRRCVGVPQLQLSGGGKYELETAWRFREAGDFLAPIAQSYAKLVTEGDPSRIRKCRNPDCVLMFYDTSKNGLRRWCSLDMCGNKLRMAALRKRQKEGAPASPNSGDSEHTT